MNRLAVAPHVARALAAGRPVVALETTLVTQGLPHPAGLETARAMEEAVRAAGALPATVGLLDGALRVGLEEAERERLVALRESAAKVNLGNRAAVRAGGGPGSTTVAATLLAARRAGIRVFATGGIGGVHRGDAGDVSARARGGRGAARARAGRGAG